MCQNIILVLIVLLLSWACLSQALTQTTATLLGPQITPFIAPATCTDITAEYYGTEFVNYLRNYKFGFAETESCYPPSFVDIAHSTIYAAYKYYSPAVCPSNWDVTTYI
jgi:hypothetical protein